MNEIGAVVAQEALSEGVKGKLDPRKIAIGITAGAGAAAIGYGLHRAYSHFRNGKKAESEVSQPAAAAESPESKKLDVVIAKMGELTDSVKGFFHKSDPVIVDVVSETTATVEGAANPK